MSRRSLQAAALACAAMLAQPAGAASTAASTIDRTRTWLIDALHIELAQHSADMNKVASIVYPLATDLKAYGRADVRRALIQAQAFLDSIDRSTADCGRLSDAQLIASFLARAGWPAPSHSGRDRMIECLQTAPPWEVVGNLLFLCREKPPELEPQVRQAVRRLEAMQGPDGSFGDESGAAAYYLSSHALLALRDCDGDPQRVRSVQRYLLQQLPLFANAGFIDGIAETLIFLKWTGAAVPDEAAYVQYLESRVLPDGSICYYDSIPCPPDWHATSLLFELQHQR